MQLKTLLNIHGNLDWRSQKPETQAVGLHFDSRKVEPGSVFVAIRGHSSDGHRYLNQVCQLNPAAVVVEDRSLVPHDFKGAVVEVLDTRLSLQTLSQLFFSQPGDQMISIAITGTNGKTSGTYMIEHLLSKQNLLCGVIGTINHHLGNKVWTTELTSPDPVTLQKRLREFVDGGAKAFVIEASSHALDQNRLAQSFDGAIFTNLSRDHLDYHQTMDNYFQAKVRLFKSATLKENGEAFAIINGDDEYGKKLVPLVEGRKTFTFGKESGNDFQILPKNQSLDGSQFEISFGTQKFFVKSPLIGDHNIYNVVSGLIVIHSLGLNFEKAIKDIESFAGIPGRLQLYKSTSGVYSFVDYAHTPDALEKSILSLKPLVPQGGRLFTVFGCGGDRDKGKRPIMGKIAATLSDVTIVTSDNPRTEDPHDILHEIMEGVMAESQGDDLPMILPCVDREEAIAMATKLAKPGDCILVAGKGHEDYQIIGTEKRPFDDLKKLKEYLK